MSAQYPMVPASPGVPPVNRTAGNIYANIVLAVADAVIVARKFLGPQWGIFNDAGAPVFVGNAVVGVDYRQSNRVADYPIEGNSFASYNKVASPWDLRISFAVDGSTGFGHYLTGEQALLGPQNRFLFLAELDQAVMSTKLYNVVTPEFSYTSANLVHYDYRRQSRGASSMLIVDVWCQEIRHAALPEFSNTKVPSGAAAVNGGSVQMSPVTGTFPGPI